VKIRVLVVAFVLTYPTVSSAEDVIATLNPIGAANARQFSVSRTTLQEARLRLCRGYGQSCMSRPAIYPFWSYDGLVDDCCPRWICLYPGPTCR
jgi:hypothetical protein